MYTSWGLDACLYAYHLHDCAMLPNVVQDPAILNSDHTYDRHDMAILCLYCKECLDHAQRIIYEALRG